jgi:hypothetical protein
MVLTPQTRHRPGLMATDLTRSLWPVRVHQLWPVAGSHSFSGIPLADFSYGLGQA